MVSTFYNIICPYIPTIKHLFKLGRDDISLQAHALLVYIYHPKCR